MSIATEPDTAISRPTDVRAFVSNTPEYYRAVKTFLDHTDQKDNALAWLKNQIAALRRRQTLIDAGAGNGKLTAWLAPSFQAVVAIEPNPSLEDELRQKCPSAAVIPATIVDARPGLEADFILCSHVFYYIPRRDWEVNLRRMAGWLAPGGVLAVAIQNPYTDCMRMVDHFLHARLNLADLCEIGESTPGGNFRARIETVPARIRTDDLEAACEVAEFILNVLPIPSPPAWADFERYVDIHFRRPEGGYQATCDQDFLRVERVV